MDGGKGGKSLALMQQRLLGKQKQQQQQDKTGADQQTNNVNNSTSTNDTDASAASANFSAGVNVNAGKSKGKDFAQMKNSQPQPLPTAPSTASQQPQQQQQNMSKPISTPTGGGFGGKSKGKDFAAMAKRNPAPSSSSSGSTSHRVAGDEKKLQQQNAARKAAGMPPISASTMNIQSTTGAANLHPLSSQHPPQHPSQHNSQHQLQQQHQQPQQQMHHNPVAVRRMSGMSTGIPGMPSQRGMTHQTHPQQQSSIQQQQHQQQQRHQHQQMTQQNIHLQQQQQEQQQQQQQQELLAPQQQVFPQHPSEPHKSDTNSTNTQPISIPPTSPPAPMTTAPQPPAPQPPAPQPPAPPKEKSDPKPTPEPTKAEGFLSKASSNVAPDTATATSSTQSLPPSSLPKPPLIGMKLSSLLKTIDPSGLFELDANAEEQLIALANDFASSLIKKSMRVAKHRHLKNKNKNGGSGGLNSLTDITKDQKSAVEVEDVSIVLKKNWGITVPGLSTTPRSSASSGRGRNSLSAGRILGLALANKPSEQSSDLAGTNGKRKRSAEGENDDGNEDEGEPAMKKINTSV